MKPVGWADSEVVAAALARAGDAVVSETAKDGDREDVRQAKTIRLAAAEGKDTEVVDDKF